MLPEMYNLIRKEWHERRAVFAACCGWMLCCVFYAIAYEWTHQFRAPVASFFTASSLYSLFAAVFLAMRTALGEQTQGTLGFSLSLPVSHRRLAWTKLAGGGLTLVLPIAIGALFMTPFLWSGLVEQAHVRPPPIAYLSMEERPALSTAAAVGLLWTVTAVVVASGGQLFLILSIFGARQKSESHVGFVGAVLAFGWTIIHGLRGMYAVVDGWLGALFPASLIINYGYGNKEGGSYGDLDLGQPLWAPLLVNVIVLILLARWFVRRYGTRRRLPGKTRRARSWRRWPAVWSRIPIPLPTHATALVWINLRQSLPLAVSGLVMACLLTVVEVSQLSHGESFRSRLPSSTWIVAALWATVVGSGIFAAELQPGLSGFWRSRPIHVAAWFWCKFFTGLFAVLVVLDGVTMGVSWGTPISYSTGLSWTYVACMPLIHATLYAMTVAGVCLLRRPVVGAMLAFAIFFVTANLMAFVTGASLEPIHVHNRLLGDEMNGRLDFTNHGYPLVYGTLAIVALVSAWLASRAIRQPERRGLISRRRNLRAAT